MIKERIDQDLKQALLKGDKALTSTLRLIKSAILYAEVDKRGKGGTLTEEDITSLLFKEAKKRQESADIYKQAGDQARTDAELAEKTVIESYLPQPLSETEIEQIVQKVIAEIGNDKQKIGQIIGRVRAEIGAAADGATIARLVQKALG